MRTLPLSAESLRAMYAGGQANATGRRFARFWALVFRLGIMPKRWVTLEVCAPAHAGRPARADGGLPGHRAALPGLPGRPRAAGRAGPPIPASTRPAPT